MAFDRAERETPHGVRWRDIALGVAVHVQGQPVRELKSAARVPVPVDDPVVGASQRAVAAATATDEAIADAGHRAQAIATSGEAAVVVAGEVLVRVPRAAAELEAGRCHPPTDCRIVPR